MQQAAQDPGNTEKQDLKINTENQGVLMHLWGRADCSRVALITLFPISKDCLPFSSRLESRACTPGCLSAVSRRVHNSEQQPES